VSAAAQGWAWLVRAGGAVLGRGRGWLVRAGGAVRWRGRALVALALAACALAAVPSAAAAALPAPPRLAAPAATVFEASTGQPVFARAAGQRRLIASTTKLMTVLVARQALPLGRVCTAPPYAAGPLESQIGLRAGERMSVHDLLIAAMLPSANDAANALAVCAAGSRAAFVARMDAQARALRLRHSHFATPVGLDEPGNYASAADLVRLALAVREDAFLRRVMDLPRARLRSGSHSRVVVNRNTLVREVPWIDGVKTGHTNAAGYILVASGTRDGLTFVDAVLGDPSEATRDADALALLKWAFASYRLAAPVARGQVEARPSVRFRPDQHVDVVAARAVRFPLARDRTPRVAIQVPHELAGPLPRGARVGTLTVRVGRRAVARVALLTARPVPAVGLLERLGRAIARPGSLVAVAALLAGSAVLLVRRREGRRRRRRRADMEAA
jgi:D-alanyl-D-alanine carboxypeptidase (penicillin-binding protein 5/6)